VSALIALHVPTMHQIMREYLGPIPFCCNYAERFAAYARANQQSVSDVFEEDLNKIETMAQEAWDYVEAATQHMNPNPVMTAPETLVPKPSGQGRRVSWRRKSIGSVLSGGWSYRRSSRRGNTVAESMLGSTSSLATTTPENNTSGDDRVVTPPLLQALGAPGASQPGQSSAAQARGSPDYSPGMLLVAPVNDRI